MVSFFVKYFTCGCPDKQLSVFWLRDTGFNQALYKVTPSSSRSVQDTLLDESNQSMLLMESIRGDRVNPVDVFPSVRTNINNINRIRNCEHCIWF